ncbi:MAG: hypothetical protein IJ794_09765 [Lachnospiraceae bacterium]|nr:hypothetical protein [Lachnospiraceae bacterium]
MDKEKFYRWLDDQIENYEQYFSILENSEKANIFSDGDVFVKNIEFLMQKNNRILLNGLARSAKSLGILLNFQAIDDSDDFAGECSFEYRGYTFFDYKGHEGAALFD